MRYPFQSVMHTKKTHNKAPETDGFAAAWLGRYAA
jgi:hypothetical protein